LGLPKELRLRHRKDFDQIFQHGRAWNDQLLVLRTLPNNLGHNRYGFVTSKRLGGAEHDVLEAMSVNALAEALGVTQSAVSQHLRVLKAAGLVRDERQGYWIYYSLNREALEKARQRLNRVCTCGCSGGEKKC